MNESQQFASDNYSGICRRVAGNGRGHQGHAQSYGDDHWTAKASDAFRALFATSVRCSLPSRTAANSLALAALCQSYHSVICYEAAHVETDECGAPEILFTAPSCRWRRRLTAS